MPADYDYSVVLAENLQPELKAFPVVAKADRDRRPGLASKAMLMRTLASISALIASKSIRLPAPTGVPCTPPQALASHCDSWLIVPGVPGWPGHCPATSGYEDAQAESIQCYAGTAPATRQSGKSRMVRIRQGCNKFLRAAVHLSANESRHQCAWAEGYYQSKPSQGKSHACALRCLGHPYLASLLRGDQGFATCGRSFESAAKRDHRRIAHNRWDGYVIPRRFRGELFHAISRLFCGANTNP